MVADQRRSAGNGLDHHQVDPDGQAGQRGSTREPVLDQPPDRDSEMGALSMVEALLSEPERPRSTPANLDDDQLDRRSRVDGDDVQLAAPDPDVPSEDRPAPARQVGRDRGLRVIAGGLRVSSHRSHTTAGRSPGTYQGQTRHCGRARFVGQWDGQAPAPHRSAGLETRETRCTSSGAFATWR